MFLGEVAAHWVFTRDFLHWWKVAWTSYGSCIYEFNWAFEDEE